MFTLTDLLGDDILSSGLLDGEDLIACQFHHVDELIAIGGVQG